MGRRNTGRVPVILPVRLWGTDSKGQPFSQMVHTIDVSRRGARLRGCQASLRVADTVGVQYRNQQARFRVTWVKTDGGKDRQVGVESLQPEKEIWGGNLPSDYRDDYVVPAAPPSRRYEKRQNERRKQMRFPVSGAVIVSNPGGVEQRSLRLGDISLEGCFIETDNPSPASTRLNLLLKLHEVEIEALGIVRASIPSTAMGVQFTHVSPPDSQRLKTIISRLQQQEKHHAYAVAADSWKA